MAPSKWAQLSFRPSVSRGDRLGRGLRRPSTSGDVWESGEGKGNREEEEDRAARWRLCWPWPWALGGGLVLLWVLVFALQCAHVTLAARGCGWGSILPCLLQARQSTEASAAWGRGVGASTGARLGFAAASGSSAGAQRVGPPAASAGALASEGIPVALPQNEPASPGLTLEAMAGSTAAARVAQSAEGARPGTGENGQGISTIAHAGGINGSGGTARQVLSAEDEEVLARGLSVQGAGEPQVALLFLVRGPLPLAPLWARFLAGHEGRFSVYIHATGGAPTADHLLPAVFRGRHIPSKGTKWGSMSIVDAERRLLGHALVDPRNSHFALLSESCVPLFNASFTYTYLTQTPHSFVDTAQELAWWSETMLPLVPERVLRKGSAWFAMQRRHAHLVAADRAFYQQFDVGWGFGHGYDEHYYQTLLAHHDPGLLANRSTTYALFKDGKAHPVTYTAQGVTAAFLQGLASATCTWNGRWAAPCFLFARKFAPDALQPLLDLLPLTASFGDSRPQEAGSASALSAVGPEQASGAASWGSQGTFDAEDEALFLRALSRKPLGTKIALLFITPDALPLAPLWAHFLAGSEGRFSIYIHGPPPAVTDPALPALFQGRHIPSKAGDAGPVTVLVAVKRLLAHALLESRNSHFVLLSEGCAPLRDAASTFRAIVESRLSFVDTAGVPSCWSQSLLPRIPREQLKRGSPWFAMVRKHAWLVLRDWSYYKAFKNGWECNHGAAQHYYQTLLPRMVAPDLANRSLTYSLEKEGGEEAEEAGPQKAFEPGDLNGDVLGSIAGRSCLGPDNLEAPCFLFARSFGPGTVETLLKLLPLPVHPLHPA